MNLGGRLREARKLIAYSFAPRNSAVYSGFDGYLNLGDEALIQAIRKVFSPYRLCTPPQSVGGLGRALTASRRHELAILGGGTLIGANLPDGSNPFRDRFAQIRARADRAITFGTGVGALSANESENKWLLEWKPLLESCSYVSVRGPESVRSLASIGIHAEMIGDPACALAADPVEPPRC